MWATTTTASAASAASGATAALEPAPGFVRGTMRGGAYIASAIARFISLEVIEGAVAPLRHRPRITVVRIVTVVDVSVEAASAVKPRPRADEEAAVEPVRSVVAIGRAAIRSVIEIAIRAFGRDANSDGYLAGRNSCAERQHKQRRPEGETFPMKHVSSLSHYWCLESAATQELHARVQG